MSRRRGAALRVCLAASGGGHVRQLLDLRPAWGAYDAFFVTEDTALGRSLASSTRTRFVAHVALGQGRLGAPLRMLAAAARNLLQSARIVLSERPDVVVSTGAGSAFFTVLWGRLTGARIVLIESFARFEGLSAFARIAGPLAHERVVQSEALARLWPNAVVFDPMRRLEAARPAKSALVFVTVGATLPFDRLTLGVAALKADGLIPERVVMQVGVGGARPDGIECHETLPFDAMLALQKEAEIVFCHGGTGSLITALREGCRVIAMPREFSLGEHYDNHQFEIATAFAARGLIEIAAGGISLAEALTAARAKPPAMATSDPAGLCQYLADRLAAWAEG